MDLFSFLVGLKRRQAVVQLPSYHNKLPRVVNIHESHLATSRFGQLQSLIAHREQLSFSVRLYDHTIVRSSQSDDRESIGAHRSFMMVNYQGQWHDGWQGVSFRYARNEEAFADRYQLPANQCMRFKNYVHPHRRESIFGAPYLLLKLLSMRLEDEITFYSKELKRLEDLGFKPKGQGDESSDRYTVGESTSEMAPTFTLALRGISLHGQYKAVVASQEGYDNAVSHLHRLQYEYLPLVQFVYRADEVAFYHFGLQSSYTAPWIKNANWVKKPSFDHYASSGYIMLTETFGIEYKTNVISVKVAA
jgi:hypothetical protein